MRVAIDEQIFAIQHVGGISRLFAELAEQYTSDPTLNVAMQPLGVPIVNHYLLDNPVLRAALQVSPARNSYTSLARYFLTRRPNHSVDVVHNTFYLPHGLTGFRGARRVVTIHDMIPEMMPETRRRLDFITLKRRYVEAADHIICVSRNTKDDLIRIYGEPQAPITVVHHGVDPMFGPDGERQEDLPSDYILFVGNRNQYKDAPTLMRAFGRIAREYPHLTLLFVGGGPMTRAERVLIRSLDLDSRISQRSLPDRQMAAAYRQAAVCVFPSRLEGFGLPALESMACGTPTVLARSSALPEVGGDAALYFAAGDDDDLAQQMKTLLDDRELAVAARLRGLERSAQFSWRHCAEQTAQVYRSTVQ